MLRNGVFWASDVCLGSCSVIYGPGLYNSTAGFSQTSCDGDIQTSNRLGFWCDYSSGDGSVIMLGGGGSACSRADHGIGITEENAAMFGGNQKKLDFGDSPSQPVTAYALNLWVK